MTEPEISDYLKQAKFKALKAGDKVWIRKEGGTRVCGDLQKAGIVGSRKNTNATKVSFFYKIMEENKKKTVEVLSDDIVLAHHFEDYALAHLHKCDYKVDVALRTFKLDTAAGRVEWLQDEIEIMHTIVSAQSR
jgi:hypothetical protein